MITILKAADRRAIKPKINIALFGPSGVGKTTQARTLDPEKTLFLDAEGGTLAIEGWDGDVLDINRASIDTSTHPWEMSRDLVAYLGGPNPSAKEGEPYSRSYHEQLHKVLKDTIDVRKYTSIFADSITVVSRHCLSWALTQPEAFNKQGQSDPRGAYGIVGREMVKWLTHLQHAPLDVTVVGILEENKDEFGRISFDYQIAGGMTGKQLPGIWDVLAVLDFARGDDGNPIVKDGRRQRAIYPTGENPYGFPGKDRSGRLDWREPPSIAGLMEKIRGGARTDNTLITTLP